MFPGQHSRPWFAGFATGRVPPLRTRRHGYSALAAGVVLAGLFPILSAETPRGDAPVILPVTDSADIRFIHVTSAEGQRHSRVAQIIQDETGFMWLTTQDSLERFDGYRFQQFRHDPRNPNGPSGTDMFATFNGSTGKLWLGSSGSLDLYDPVTETFTHYQSSAQASKWLRGVVFDVAEDRQGLLWIATDYGLVRLNRLTRQITGFEHHEGDPTSLSSNSVRSTFEDNDGTFWIATTEGLDVLDRTSGKITQHIPLPANFPRPDPTNPYLYIGFCQDHTGVLWVYFGYG